MLLRITTKELKECGSVGKDLAQSLYNLTNFYEIEWPYNHFGVKKLLSAQYIQQLMYSTGDKRTTGGKLGRKDFFKFATELGV